MKPAQFPEIRIVEASAGSGKTYALARRYLQLLINPSLKKDDIPLKNILAITFTNKATVEMKERILEFLKMIALDAFPRPEDRDSLLSSFGVPAASARIRARLLLDHLMRNYDHFQVQTIDSFVNALVSGCAFKLQLSSQFRIETAYREYLARSLDALIEKAESDSAVRAVFSDFLLQYLRIEDNQGWFPRDTIMDLVADLYTGSTTYGGTLTRSAEGNPKELFALKRGILDAMRGLADELPEGTDKRFASGLFSFIEKNPDTFSLDGLSAYFARESFPVNKGRAVPARVAALWDGIRRSLDMLCRHEASSYFNCYIDIFNMVLGDFHALSRRDDVLFLPELNRQAGELFSVHALPVPELYYRLATRFRHFLIDEFQDTSVLQWNNLFPLADELLASGGSLFYVGDKKQAIYRFRGGDAGLFDAIPRSFPAFPCQREALSVNYRSHRAVVEFNNGEFSPEHLKSFLLRLQEDREVPLQAADIEEITGIFSGSRQEFIPSHDRGLVSVCPVDGGTREERDAATRGKIVSMTAELRGRFAARDIAVLVRDNSEVERVTGWLLGTGIPAASDKTMNVRENRIIKELVSLLLFLNSPIDDLSFASFATGTVFSAATGMDTAEIREFIFSRHTVPGTEREAYLYRDFRRRWPDIWDRWLEQLFVTVGFVPLYELAVSIIAAFGIMERHPDHRAFVLRFLELIKGQEDRGTGIAPFMDYFNAAEEADLFVSMADTDAVRVLTIHKSKGLEFPVVIVPFLAMNLASSRRGKASFEIREGAGGLSLIRVSKKHAQYSHELAELYRARYRRALIDELNTVYVALTRPRCELHVYVPSKAGSSLNPARFLLPEEEYVSGSPGVYPPRKAPPSLRYMDMPAVRARDWISLIKYEFADEHRLEQRENMRRGEMLHFALSLVGNCTDRTCGDIVSAAAEGALRMFPSGPLDRGTLEKKVRAVITAPAARDLFFVDGAEVFSEKEQITEDGEIRRIDRLIVGKGRVVIVDYKSSRGGGGSQQSQVREYMRLTRGLYPARDVRGYLLYLDTLEVEEIK